MTSKIEWTDTTWNPVTGCTKISPGCANCYSERMTKRLQAMGQQKYRHGFNRVVTHHDELTKPSRWTKPRKVFVCSMSDLFHQDVPDHFIRHVFSVMGHNRRHIFQVLTKRSERLLTYAQLYPSDFRPRNIWVGVSVENQDVAEERISHLIGVPSAVRFLSCEPLLGPLYLGEWLAELDWVIVGGESGPRARPMDPDWVRSIRDDCFDTATPFFFKQWGGKNKRKTGRELDGRLWDEYPTP